jgi:hypothetical protein
MRGAAGQRAALVIAALGVVAIVDAEEPRAAPSPAPTPGISDNSFLLEEAYNQERGVVQHINSLTRFGSSDWVYTFTQEWPVPAQAHQLSFTVPIVGTDGGTGVGDVALNYRYQAVDRARVAVAPRLSVLLATGASARGRGAGGTSFQTNVPVSLSFGGVVAHTNLGATLTPRAKDEEGETARTVGWNAGQSVVWLTRPRFNVLLEVAFTRAQEVIAPRRTVRSDSLFVSPGIRWAYNFRSGLQIVPGLAVPVGIGPSDGQHGVFLYLSFEHPFRNVRETSPAGP